MLRGGDSTVLNEKTYPNCYLHRSSPNDVARTEHLTYICAPDKDDVGPTNNWMDPDEAQGTKSERCSTAPCAAAPCTWCPTSWAR